MCFMVMVRQCAWCLCLINSMGERISSSPLPKLYEASHGICSACGTAWLTQAIETSNIQKSIYPIGEVNHKVSMGGNSAMDQQEQAELVTQFILQLQQPRPKQSSLPKGKRHSRIISS
jgi:hypothetical protein